MNVGVVGAGKWGQNIVRTLHELGYLGGVADDWAATRESLKENYPGVSVFSSVEDLFASGIEAVCIATPAPAHFEIAKKAIDAGLHTFIEKPMTLTASHARELCELADAENLTLMVGHLLIYQPAVTFIKEYIESGKLGDLVCLNHERLGLGRARDVENVLWSLGVHDIAVCLHLAQSRAVESAFSGVAALQPNIEDDTRLSIKFEDGSVGNIHNSWLWPVRRRVLTVVGTKAMLVYDELAQTVTLHKKSIAVPSLDNIDEGEEQVFEGAGSPLTIEMEHFVDCFNSGKKPHTDGWSALEVVKVMEQVSPVTVQA